MDEEKEEGVGRDRERGKREGVSEKFAIPFFLRTSVLLELQ